jgi:hypothetical protein
VPHPPLRRSPAYGRWLTLIVVVIVFATLAWLTHLKAAARTQECLRLYQAAANASDTLAVDRTVPFGATSLTTSQAPTCGDLRRLDKLQ